MKVYVASDHAGFHLKEGLKVWLAENSIADEDMGAFSLESDDDYPDFVFPVAQKVAEECSKGGETLGIVIGKSGSGEAIAANKVKGIRAVVCTNEEMARLARTHNDANIISLGTEFVDEQTAKHIIKVFLETPFSGEERHIRRIQKISSYEASKA